MTRTRTIVTFLLLSVLALIGAGAAFAMHGFAATYADPTASAGEHLASNRTSIAVALALLTGLAIAAVAISRGPLRRPVVALSIALVAASAIAMVGGTYFGLGAKQKEASAIPSCGIGDAGLTNQWRSLDHPGYFEGGEESADHCSYQMTAKDVAGALKRYEQQLAAEGWRVSQSSTSRVEATRDGYEFEAAVINGKSPDSSPLLVTLRKQGK